MTYECGQCHVPQRMAFTGGQHAIQCAGCKVETSLRAGAIEGTTVCACALCGTPDLYVQKDFPHRLGLAIVLVGIAASSIAWAYYWYPIALGVLMVTALFDLCLYYVMGSVVVCYRCLAQYRGTDRNTQHHAFDLAIGERYRQERIRLEALRRLRKGS